MPMVESFCRLGFTCLLDRRKKEKRRLQKSDSGSTAIRSSGQPYGHLFIGACSETLYLKVLSKFSMSPPPCCVQRMKNWAPIDHNEPCMAWPARRQARSRPSGMGRADGPLPRPNKSAMCARHSPWPSIPSSEPGVPSRNAAFFFICFF
jgi:hypothetical protein